MPALSICSAGECLGREGHQACRVQLACMAQRWLCGAQRLPFCHPGECITCRHRSLCSAAAEGHRIAFQNEGCVQAIFDAPNPKAYCPLTPLYFGHVSVHMQPDGISLGRVTLAASSLALSVAAGTERYKFRGALKFTGLLSPLGCRRKHIKALVREPEEVQKRVDLSAAHAVKPLTR